MSNDVQKHESKTTNRKAAFANGVQLGSRNRKEFALFFRLRKTTVVTILASSAVIVTAVCVALCTFSIALHYTIKSNVMSATQLCGLLAFGLVTICAFVATTTLLAAALRATRAIHAALHPPLLRSTLSYGKTSDATPTLEEAIEHFWRPPIGSTDAKRNAGASFSESATASGNQTANTETRVTSGAIEGQTAPTDRDITLESVSSLHGNSQLYPTLP
ncbi:hypothetical protein ANPL_04480 [Anaplasma platys]|uniref:Uncharacterized protein n=1 Tax=Anaplasma platys TaxID=949 RepID=A0A858PZD1_9RICK|nr:hypothetical protein [Anaplasma platys]QJC27939.1 hypothetical protein ANPL_04480 [Anaplasma platys]